MIVHILAKVFNQRNLLLHLARMNTNRAHLLAHVLVQVLDLFPILMQNHSRRIIVQYADTVIAEHVADSVFISGDI